MIVRLLTLLFGVALGYALVVGYNLRITPAAHTAQSAPPPPRSGQPHTDIFSAAGISNMQLLNPINQLALRPEHTVAYRLLTMPGCVTGTIPQAMGRVELEASGKLIDTATRTPLRLVRNDTVFNFTIRINCGSEQIRICGAVTIFCLGRGFPYVADVELSDILSSYQFDTQLAIPLHEVIGHALATWNEQYCTGNEPAGPCQGLPLFTSTPGWRDIMNTGPDSRHGLEDVELERWSRTMFNVLRACSTVGYDDCTGRWYQADGWSWDPAGGNWFTPTGLAEWTPCNRDGIRYNLQLGFWSPPGSGVFVPSRGFWSFAPVC